MRQLAELKLRVTEIIKEGEKGKGKKEKGGRIKTRIELLFRFLSPISYPFNPDPLPFTLLCESLNILFVVGTKTAILSAEALTT